MELRLYAPDGAEYLPLPKQIEFHSSPAKFRAYIGGFGSGKTLSGCVEALMLGLDYPGIRILVGRKTYGELQATTLADFLRVCPKELIQDHNKSTGFLTLTNGSEFVFWNLQDPEKVKSLNLGAFYIDEATEVTEEMFKALRGRLRQTKDLRGKQVPRCGILTSNPNGHDWLWAYFVKNQGQPYYRDNYRLIHAPTKDNKYLPADYLRDLEETYPPEWLARFMEGSFDVFEGQVYPMIDENVHLIPHEFGEMAQRYVEPLVKYRVIDHGYTNPTVCLWCAVDHLGNLIFFREYRKTNTVISLNCQAIIALSGAEDYLKTLIDPSTRNKTGQGDGRSFLEEYRENGLNALPANNQKKAGILRVSDYLRVRTSRVNPFTGIPGAPMLFFHPSCLPTFEEMRQLAWKKLKPHQQRHRPLFEDTEEGADHGADCVRYMAMDRAPAAQQAASEDPYRKLLTFIHALGDNDEGEHSYARIGQQTNRRTIQLPNGQRIITGY